MKILIPALFRGNGWIGGSNYFLSLVAALRSHPGNDGTSVVVLSNRPEAFGPRVHGEVEVRDAPWLDATARPDYFLNGAANIIARYNPRLYGLARSIGADLITHAPAGRHAPCLILHWMPDFQHRHLPGYFSAYERWRRDRNVETAAATGHLLVSSQSAATDFHRFYPHRRRTRVHVLRFTPHLGQEVPLLPKQALLSRYALRDDFFFLPNQFWRHKNHRIVLEALRRLPDHVQVVATGAVSDSRGDAHIRQLLQVIDSHALQQKFRMLGLLPRQEMLSLMRHARCVINPSLFEGWSTVVEEAKFFGKRLILSDIPVHREQAAVDALYFDPHDAGALAIAMETAVREHDPRAEAVRAGMAQVAFGAASSEFAARYRSIAESVALDR